MAVLFPLYFRIVILYRPIIRRSVLALVTASLHELQTSKMLQCTQHSASVNFGISNHFGSDQRINLPLDVFGSVSSSDVKQSAYPSLVGCDAVSLSEYFPTFRRIVVPLSPRYKGSRHISPPQSWISCA
jgi:hypothetical protein